MDTHALASQNSDASNIVPSPSQNPQGSDQIKPSGIMNRLSAAFFDDTIIGFFVLIVASLFIFIFPFTIPIADKQFNEKFNGHMMPVTFVGVLLSVLYYAYFHTTKGETPGKSLYGLKVNQYKTTAHITFPQALLREVVKCGVVLIPVVGGLISLINNLVILFSKEKRGFHDYAGKSQVIQIGKAAPFWKQLLFIILILLADLGIIFFLFFPRIGINILQIYNI